MDPNQILDDAINALRQVATNLEEYRRGLSLAGGAGPVLQIGSPSQFHQNEINRMQEELTKAHARNADLADRLARAQQQGFAA